MKRMLLERQEQTNHYTIGELWETNDSGEEATIICKTLELAWRNNARNISCIPTGNYLIRRHTSPRFGVCVKVFHEDGIREVSGRANILFHVGNFVNWNNNGVIQNDTEGCILPVSRIAGQTPTGVFGATSAPRMAALLETVGVEEWELTVRNAATCTVDEPVEATPEAAPQLAAITLHFAGGGGENFITATAELIERLGN